MGQDLSYLILQGKHDLRQVNGKQLSFMITEATSEDACREQEAVKATEYYRQIMLAIRERKNIQQCNKRIKT